MGRGLFPQQQGLGEVHRAGEVVSSNWCTPRLEVAGTASVERVVDGAGRRLEEEVEEAWVVAEAELEDLLGSQRAAGGARMYISQ